ncbi:hypothetical protein JXQ31_11180 [candidate division KSB1 bacterium]|nr:hypothetical protein [candidate division KSB1 bacterium]
MKGIKENIIKVTFILLLFFISDSIIASENNTTDQNKSETKDNTQVENSFILEKNFQKPFEQKIEFSFKLLKPGTVKLTIFNIEGEEIRTLSTNYFKIGLYNIVWDGNNNSGKPVKSGVYRYSLRVQDFEQSYLIAYLR